jgi:hypothetical protein
MSLLTGLTAYYKLDGNANKSVGTNNGTATGVTYGPGKTGQAAIFNGSADIQIPVSSDFTFGVSDFTVGAWFKFNANGIRYFIAGQSNSLGSNGSVSFLIEKESTNIITGFVCFGSLFFQVNSGAITDFNWHFLVLQRDSTILRLLVDNIEVASVVIGAISINNSSFNMGIGCGGEIPSLKLDGRAEEFGFWNRALSSSELTFLYNNGNGRTYPFSSSNFFPFFT